MKFAECNTIDIYVLSWERQSYLNRRWMASALVCRGEESRGQQAENTKEILDNGMSCVGLGWRVHEFIRLSKHLAKLNFTFRKEKKLNRFWGIFRIEVSLLQINLLLLQMSDTTALRRVGIKELGEITLGGISLVVLWLRLHLPVQGLQVQFLVRELRSHMPSSERNQNISNSSNIVTNSTRTFKMAHKKKT